MNEPLSKPPTNAERISLGAVTAFAGGMALSKYFHPLIAFLASIAFVVILHFVLANLFGPKASEP